MSLEHISHYTPQVAAQIAARHIIRTSTEYAPDFEHWIVHNWPVYQEFERRALALCEKGRTHLGSKMIWEVMRYYSLLAEKDNLFRLNNNRTADVARLFEALNPQYQGTFEFRERKVAS